MIWWCLGLTKSMSKEYGNRGIRVNMVAPGFIETPMTASNDTYDIGDPIRWYAIRLAFPIERIDFEKHSFKTAGIHIWSCICYSVYVELRYFFYNGAMPKGWWRFIYASHRCRSVRNVQTVTTFIKNIIAEINKWIYLSCGLSSNDATLSSLKNMTIMQ
jgi:hypothetical protein